MKADRARIVIVSNRVAHQDRKEGAAAGGLAVALRDVMRKRRGIWFGWSGAISEQPADEAHLISRGTDNYATMDLTAEEREQYYISFANRALWPVMHYRLGLTEFSRTDYLGYLAVNERFAAALARLLTTDDIIWVHDYHMIPLGAALRRRGVSCRIGYFHHIPWPPPEVFGALPSSPELMRCLGAYDLIGVQTPIDVRNVTAGLQELCGGKPINAGIRLNNRDVRIASFPVGIDAKGFRKLAETAESMSPPALRRALAAAAKQRFVIGVDRLDYSKGIVQRLQAFERFLLDYPSQRHKVSLLQIAPPSRAEVPEYMELDRLSDETAGRINATLADLDWTPIRVVKKAYGRQVLAGLFRYAAIGLVTPMRDGMNLVAKEYVAAQNPADPGVLVLSRFAGTAHQMPEALIVNPFDIAEVADAIETALNMDKMERQERYSAMYRGLQATGINVWADTYLEALEGAYA